MAGLVELFDDVRRYLFYYPYGMVNNPVQFALLIALLLVFLNDIRKSSVVWGILAGTALVFMSTKEFHILSMPLLSSYVTFRASERFEGKTAHVVIAVGFLLFVLACSFDGFWGTAV